MIFSRWRVPSWSAFEDRTTHDAFVAAVDGQLREFDLPVVASDDGRSREFARGVTLDLAPVSAAAAASSPEDWPEIIRGPVASATNPNRPPSDPERLRAAVRVRLMTAAALERMPKELPHRRHADLAEVLVIDTTRSLVWAGVEDLAPMGMELDELFSLGRDNVRGRVTVTTTTAEIAGDTVTVAEGSSDYIASWALLVDHLLDVPRAGVVVAVPTRFSLLARALDGSGAGDSLDGLAAEAAARADAGPGSLSPRLYLWQDGELSAHG